MDQDPPRYGQRLEDSSQQAPVCPRHPDTVAYVDCRRCGRPVCPACQVQTPVGVQCTDCTRQDQQRAARRTAGSGMFPRAGSIPVTWGLITACVLVYLLQTVVPGYRVENLLAYNSVWTDQQPWRMLTSGFVHSGLVHLGLNMYTLYLFGQALEPRLGRWRYLAVYLLSVVGGSAAVWWLAPGTWVVGASGGIFGLFGALFVWTRFRGGDTRALVLLVVLNLVFGLMVGGISWQAHLGGLFTGALVTWILQLAQRGRTPRGAGHR